MKKLIFAFYTAAMFGNLALGADTAHKHDEMKGGAAMTLEHREKMAGAHEKMAVCLRSDRPMRECKEEMMKTCKENMGTQGCPMMDGKMNHEMNRSMMNHDEAAK